MYNLNCRFHNHHIWLDSTAKKKKKILSSSKMQNVHYQLQRCTITDGLVCLWVSCSWEMIQATQNLII